jgi:hypothetical protein
MLHMTAREACMIHHPTHWIAVAAVSALALLAFEAAGQTAGSSAVFEGRPTLAGAQGGLGAQAGMPQGGIGVQGSEAAQMNLRKPRIIEESTLPGPRVTPGAQVVAVLDGDRILPPKLEPDTTPSDARRLAREAR